MKKSLKKQKTSHNLFDGISRSFINRESWPKRVISLGLFFLIILTISVVFGRQWYLDHYRPLHQIIVEVNDVKFDMRYYIDLLRLEQISPGLISDDLAEEIIGNELVRQGAADFGIVVQEREIRQKLKDENLPVNDASKDFMRSKVLKDILLNQYFENQIPRITEQRHIIAMLLADEDEAREIAVRIEAGEKIENIANTYSVESFTKAHDGDFGWKPSGMVEILVGTPTIDNYAFNTEPGILSPPLFDKDIRKDVGYWILKILDRKKEANVSGMLFASQEEAEYSWDRINAGETFDELLNSSSYEILSGWFKMNEAGPTFDEHIFQHNRHPGEVCEPIVIETPNHEQVYSLIKVLAYRERATVQGILVGSRNEALEVKEMLGLGEDFGEIAIDYSEDEKSQNDGGIFNVNSEEGSRQALLEYVFAPQTSLDVISEPIRDTDSSTHGGYWLVKAIDIDSARPINEEDRNKMQIESFNKWIESLRSSSQYYIAKYMDADKESWAIEYLLKS